MHNQHAGLSQPLAEQRITEQHEQAARAGSPPALGPAATGAGWPDGGSWPAGHASLPSVPDRRAPSLKRVTRRVS